MVALGIAKGHTMRRRVAIADLVGDSPLLASLVKDADPHGVVDCITYGLNLGAVAREVAGQVNLFVLPTGKDGEITENVFRDERWRKLASSFKEIGALLLIVARSSATGVRMLARLLDGAIAVGESTEATGSWANLIASVDLPGEAARRASRLEMQAVSEGAEPLSVPQLHTPRHTRAAQRAAAEARRRRLLIGAGAALGLVLLLGGGTYWQRDRIMQRIRSLGSGSGERGGSSGSRAPSLPPVVEVASMAANPADSAGAAAWSVEIIVANTKSGADAKLRELTTSYASATWGQVREASSAQRYSVVVGASQSRAGAESMLGTLRSAGVLAAGAGRVVRRPFSLLIKEGVGHDEALLEILGYQSLGYPAYGLAAADGRVRIYAGAFTTADQARSLAASLQQAGIQSTVVYRLGRTL
jgi:cell division septation protein DedD